jgi:hypothetical protein
LKSDWNSLSPRQLAEYGYVYLPKSPEKWDWSFRKNFPLSQIVPRGDLGFWQDQYDEYFRKEGQSFIDLEQAWLDDPLAIGPLILSQFSKNYPTLGIEDGNHRIAISIRRRLKHVPVILGKEKTCPADERQGTLMRHKKKYPKLSPRERELASKYIAEEVRTGQYSQVQAEAIGISRARRASKDKQNKPARHRPARSRIASLIARYQ